MSKIDSGQIESNIENFDKIYVLNASVRNWSSQQRNQVPKIEQVPHALCMTTITASKQIKYRQNV